MRNDKGISQLKARDKTKVRAVDKLPEVYKSTSDLTVMAKVLVVSHC
jgi:hypothetical protein